MPSGKPAGMRCVQLLPDQRCAIFGQSDRPAFCAGLQPSAAMCGNTRAEAIEWLARLEVLTAPVASRRR